MTGSERGEQKVVSVTETEELEVIRPSEQVASAPELPQDVVDAPEPKVGHQSTFSAL